MQTSTETAAGRVALIFAHCAGMVDLIALPVWMGALIGEYRFDPQQAGGLVTLFLLGVVLSSIAVAPKLGMLPGRLVASCGYMIAAAAFYAVSSTQTYGLMAAGHAVAGLSVGAALSVTHGTIARSLNPHRLFAIVGIGLGFFAIAFQGGVPVAIANYGGPILFKVFAGVMAAAAAVSGFAFPHSSAAPPTRAFGASGLGRPVWAGIAGVVGLALVQAMIFSFVERIGIDRGFGADRVLEVLIALGIVNLFPSPLAALLQRRLPATRVLIAAPLAQAAIALTITMSPQFLPYAASTSILAAVVIFTHPFAFGTIARLDPSGRALAGTPAMMMLGSAIGPILGGTLVKLSGYGSLGVAAVVIAAATAACFSSLREPPLVIAPAVGSAN